jgi:phosphonate transport system ATP-binding protein
LLAIPLLRIGRGERVAIIGPNAAGKSTLLGCLSGFVRPTQGEVEVLGRRVTRQAPSELRSLRKEVAQVLQGLHLVQRLSALDNVMIGGLGRLSGWRSWTRCYLAGDVQEALEALDAVGLRQRAHQRTDRLSGGERQKVAIARMLMQRAGLILADEPTANLDPTAAADTCRLLAARARRATLLTIVHQVELLPLIADRVIGLRQGQIVVDLAVDAFDDAAIRALYGSSSASSLGPAHRSAPIQGNSTRVAMQ